MGSSSAWASSFRTIRSGRLGSSGDAPPRTASLRRVLRSVLALTVAVTLLSLTAPAFAAGPTRPAGTYTGHAGTFSMQVAGRSIVIVGFDFKCRGTTGRTTLSEIPIKRVRGRWRFSIRTFGNVTYRDDVPDENARVRLTGAFTKNGRRLTARVVIATPRCGSVTAMYSAVR